MAAKGLWTVLNVDNVEKSVEFYKALGFRPRLEPTPGVPGASMGSVDLGGSGLVFWNKHIVPPDQAPDTQAWVSGDLGKGVLFSVGVRDANAVWAKAQQIRAEVDQPLAAQPWGGHGFNLVDLDGYVVGITDKFPAPPPKKAKRAVKRVATKAKRATRKVAMGKRR